MIKKYLVIHCAIVILIFFLIYWTIINDLPDSRVLTLGLLFLLILELFVFYLLAQFIKKSQAELVDKNRKSLRVYGHDFINHLQVIYSFLQLKKIDQACEYIIQARDKIHEVHK